MVYNLVFTVVTVILMFIYSSANADCWGQTVQGGVLESPTLTCSGDDWRRSYPADSSKRYSVSVVDKSGSPYIIVSCDGPYEACSSPGYVGSSVSCEQGSQMRLFITPCSSGDWVKFEVHDTSIIDDNSSSDVPWKIVAEIGGGVVATAVIGGVSYILYKNCHVTNQPTEIINLQ
jgi:hypothetical protein